MHNFWASAFFAGFVSLFLNTDCNGRSNFVLTKSNGERNGMKSHDRSTLMHAKEI